jgi:predicted DNA-binding transcriptional regulator AlpA
LQGEPVNDPAMVFLISAEAADLLRISRRTLERMRVDGTGPRYLKVGPGKRSRVLYRQSEVLAWLERQTYGSTSEYKR